ncbi:hypothetical protein ACFFX0_31190 [Citricoccus parietis]|uniref:Uncharacterized protein n=1 Tax=Citricoccus parietis TaxID=592307 RepID=A0ABV5G8U9_9MICC
MSKTIRSGTRGRWQPSGWESSTGGRSISNWHHRGSMIEDGSAGTGKGPSPRTDRSHFHRSDNPPVPAHSDTPPAGYEPHPPIRAISKLGSGEFSPDSVQQNHLALSGPLRVARTKTGRIRR